MGEHQRFLLTFDAARGIPIKVERVGEAGELTEVDLQGFLHSLAPGPAAHTPQQIIINIYGGGAQGTPVVGYETQPPKPPSSMDWGPKDVPYGSYKPKEEE